MKIDLKEHLSEGGRGASIRERIAPRAPGIYPASEVSMEEYLAWDCVSASTLVDVLREGPTFARWAQGFKHADTDATKLGTAIHGAILEPERFLNQWAVRQSKGTGVRAAMAELEAKGVKLISQSQMDIARCCRAQVDAHSRAQKLIDGAPPEDREVSIIFKLAADPLEGAEPVPLLGKLRLDLLRRDLKIACDLKSARDISRRELARAFAGYSYELTKCWYSYGLQLAGIDVDTYLFLAIENALPCRVRLFEMGQASTSLGQDEMRMGLRLWAQCVKSDRWPEEDEAVLPLELPEWKFNAWAARIGEGGA